MHDILIGMFGISHNIALHMQYIIDGIIGGTLYIIIRKYGWCENKINILRRLFVGAVAGHLVFIANWPNSLTAMSLGYVGIDGIESILNRVQPKTSYYSKKKTGRKIK